MVEIKYVTV